MEDDAPAPTLSLAELEERFADLQAVLHEKDEAIAKIESLSTAKPGTEEYDDVFSEWGTDEQTRTVIQQLVRELAPLSLREVSALITAFVRRLR
eukprot:3461322-Prymnesium_polylepis.1